jgi:hypothetical protein
VPAPTHLKKLNQTVVLKSWQTWGNVADEPSPIDMHYTHALYLHPEQKKVYGD